jgi:uncharacterized protein YecE (DUF72 family)
LEGEEQVSYGGLKCADPIEHPTPNVIRVGCAGWNIPRVTVAEFRPEGTHLERYSRTFNCCEINSSFYRPHKYSTWDRWSATVPEEFRFSVKFPRTITHEVELKCEPDDLKAFLTQVGFLREKLGVLLIQLPPGCIFEPVIAKRFFALLRNQHAGDVVLEARHGTWFDPRVENLLEEFEIAGAAADPACVPAAGQPSGFRQVAYFRLHGSPRRYYSPYSAEFVKAMATRLADLAKHARVWCIFDNTAAGFATFNALQLDKELGKRQP